MFKYLYFFILVFIISACICGGKTECTKNPKISILDANTELCSDPFNKKFNEQEHLSQMYNFLFDGIKIEAVSYETCENNTEVLKALFKTMIWVDIDCLQPPHFLGFVGPSKESNLEVALKVTSAFKIPHIVNTPASSLYAHQLDTMENQYISKGILKIIEIFKWKSLKIIDNSKHYLMKNIAKQFIEDILTTDLCLLSLEDPTLNIVYFGEPEINLIQQFRNSRILIISENDFELKLKKADFNNSLVLINNVKPDEKISNSDIKKLKLTNKISASWTDDSKTIFLQEAVVMFAKALQILCNNKNCYVDKNSDEWNEILAQTFATYGYQNKSKIKTYQFIVKDKHNNNRGSGKIKFSLNNTSFYWNNEPLDLQNIHNYEQEKLIFQSFFMSDNETNSKNECLSKRKLINTDNKNLEKYKSTSFTTFEMTDSEWWSMVSTVAAVGIAMFTIGFFAVYVVYTNIRGPRNTKEISKQNFNRDSSLRRVGSDRQEAGGNNRHQRTTKNLQRRDSRSSIRSNISEKSV